MDDSIIEDQERKSDKRKRAGSSSLSELDTSKDIVEPSSESPSKSASRKIKRKKKKKELKLQEEQLKLIPEKSEEATEGGKREKGETGEKCEMPKNRSENTSATSEAQETSKEMEKELHEIKALLGNIMTKNDETLKSTIRETMLEMKDDILKSLTNRLEVVEGDLHSRAKEIETLQKDVATLKTACEEQKEENKTLRKEIDLKVAKNESLIKQNMNELEQYQRRNNIRISGIKDREDEKTCFQTMEAVCLELNNRAASLNLTMADIDIAHRLGKYKKDKNRNIIVRFVSRATKIRVFQHRKELKSKDIYVNEDLTKLNQDVLTSVRVKKKDIIEQAWSFEGKIYAKPKEGETRQIQYAEFDTWTNLPWPEKAGTSSDD